MAVNDYSTSTDAFSDLGVGDGNYTTSDYPIMTTFVTAASRLIDLEVGKWPGFFYPTTDTIDLYYDGNNCAELDIDMFASISAVAVSEQGGIESSDYTALSTTDFVTWPYNTSLTQKPIKKLIIDNLNASPVVSIWPRYRKAVKVSGFPGYFTSPPDIVARACRRQAIQWFMAAKQGYQQEGASANIGGMTFTTERLDSNIKEMLWPYILEFSA
jgi:hypothetical protein